MKMNRWKAMLVSAAMAVFGNSVSQAHPTPRHHSSTDTNASYVEVNLVSDIATNAPRSDLRLVNPWGLMAGPGVVWVNDNGSGLTTVYVGLGHPFDFAINIAAPDGTNAGTPTGLVFNDTRQFVVTNGVESGPGTFFAATEDGTITAWNSAAGSNAVIVVDNSGSGAVYKGLAIARLTNGAPQLYAANFHAGVVEVFDTDFQHVGSFTDTNLPAGFAPFNIKNIDGDLYVTFALQDADAHDDQAGPGNGYVDVFAPDGTLLRHLVSQGALNSPWGLAVAPRGFGLFSQALLVGNFGDGLINAYDLSTGSLLGHMTRPDGSDLVIDGLWGLDFTKEGWFSNGHGFAFGPKRLYFTAGSNHEADGLFGYITPFGPGPRGYH